MVLIQVLRIINKSPIEITSSVYQLFVRPPCFQRILVYDLLDVMCWGIVGLFPQTIIYILEASRKTILVSLAVLSFRYFIETLCLVLIIVIWILWFNKLLLHNSLVLMLELVFPHAVNQDEGSLVDHQWFSIVGHV